ncbi:MAG: cell division protein FtsQ/DivIB [Neisseriaceae bacterium]
MQQRKVRRRSQPTLFKVAVKYLFLFLLMGVGLVFLCWVYFDSNWLAIKKFNVVAANGKLQHVSFKQIEQVLAPYRTRMTLLRINVNRIKQDFKVNDWVKSVRVERHWPDTVRVVIAERVPVAQWVKPAGRLVDDEGELFKGSSERFLVLFKGEVNTEKALFQLYKKIEPLLHQQGLALLEIEYTNRSTWILTLNNQIKVFLGRENIVAKLEQLLKVWPQLIQSDDRNIKEIHAEYKEGFAVKYQEKQDKLVSEKSPHV